MLHVWLPYGVDLTAPPERSRGSGVLIICSERSVMTVVPERLDLSDALPVVAETCSTGAPFLVAVMDALLQKILAAYENEVRALERGVTCR